MVISDHGFSVVPPRRQPERWLLREGYLALKPGADGSSRVAARRRLVADARLRARPDRACSSTSQGREAQGIVEPGRRGGGAQGGDHRQAARPARRRDGRRSASAKRSTPPRSTTGPYLENAPDLIIGYNAGYRTSWDCATGVVSRSGLRGQHSSRGAAITASIRGWCPACSSATAPIARRRPALDRHRAHGAAPVRHRAAGAHGRPAVRPSHDDEPARACSSPALALAARRWRACGATARASTGRKVIVLGFDGLDYELTRAADGRRPPAELRAARERGRLRAARHDDAAAEPGGVVDLHHRPRSRRARHLRLRPSRSEDDGAVPVDDADRAARPDRSTSAAGSCRCRAAASSLLRHGQPFWEVLEARGIRDDDHPHAGELSAVGHGHARAERHGHAGHARHLRHLRALSRREPYAERTDVCRAASCYPVDVSATAWSARRSRGRTTRSSKPPSRCGAVHARTSIATGRHVAARRRRRGAPADGRRVERLGAGQLSRWCRRSRCTARCASF